MSWRLCLHQWQWNADHRWCNCVTILILWILPWSTTRQCSKTRPNRGIGRCDGPWRSADVACRRQTVVRSCRWVPTIDIAVSSDCDMSPRGEVTRGSDSSVTLRWVRSFTLRVVVRSHNRATWQWEYTNYGDDVVNIAQRRARNVPRTRPYSKLAGRTNLISRRCSVVCCAHALRLNRHAWLQNESGGRVTVTQSAGRSYSNSEHLIYFAASVGVTKRWVTVVK